MTEVKCTPHFIGSIPFLSEESSKTITFNVRGSRSQKQKASELTEKDIWYMYGVLAALDVVFLYDASTMAEEIVGANDSEKLLRVAELDEYLYLAELKEIIRRLQ
jgi:hypothetical protein